MWLKLYLIALPVFMALDGLWLGVVARRFYRDRIGWLLADKPDWLAAGLFYLLFVAGILFFVVQPALDKVSWRHALFAGAFFGLVTYAAYDLTNQALTRDWPVLVTVVDLAWGATLCATVAVATFAVARKLGVA